MCVPTTTSSSSPKLAKCDEWIKTYDHDAFTADMKKLGDELEKNQGEADVRHLNKMIMWSNICGLVGMLTMGLGVGIIPVVGLSTFTFSRWTMIAHHTCHRGYDKCHPNKKRWNRFKFAVGSLWTRMCDWFDWMVRFCVVVVSLYSTISSITDDHSLTTTFSSPRCPRRGTWNITTVTITA